MTENRFGLKRHIPDAIKRKIRQRDGFGCVVCGFALYDYDHFSPEFADAKQHEMDGIVLLCPSCHRQKGTFLSMDAVAASAANPKCRQVGFSHGAFDLPGRAPTIFIGKQTFRNATKILNIHSEDVLAFSAPEQLGGPWRLSAKVTNKEGITILEIDKNRWKAPVTNWDIQVMGKRVTIRENDGSTSFVFKKEDAGIRIEKLDLQYRGVEVRLEDDEALTIKSHNAFLRLREFEITGFDEGIVVDQRGVSLATNGRSGVKMLLDAEGSVFAINPHSRFPNMLRWPQPRAGASQK